MSLTLPANFKRDIQPRDTNLVPIVIIGNFNDNAINWLNSSLHISTNQMSYYGDQLGTGNTYYTLPLLNNIPSLKESIDIENRKYKISSINLSISNFEYEGQRFSDRIDSSLLNTECRIYWWSPTTTWLHAIDKDTTITDPEIAFQVYFGSIRKYEHDDEKVKLTVEDRSQESLHKDLPGPEDNVGVGLDVPDKYKNKPIPIVYGTVDKSPCVIKSTAYNDANEPIAVSLKSGVEQHTYNSSEIVIGTKTIPQSALYFFINDTYYNVQEDISTHTNFSYKPTSAEINFIFSDENYTSDNNLGVYIIRDFVKVIDHHNPGGYTGTDQQGTGLFYNGWDGAENDDAFSWGISNAFDGREDTFCLIKGNLKYAKHEGGGSIYYDNEYAMLEFKLDSISNLDTAEETNTEGNVVPIKIKTWFLVKVDHDSNPGTSPGFVKWSIWQNHNGYFFRIPLGANLNTSQYEGQGLTHVTSYTGVFEIAVDDINSTFSEGNQNPYELTSFDTVDKHLSLNLGIPRHNILNGSSSGYMDVYTKIYHAFIYQELIISGIVDKEYYANVNGRLVSSGTQLPKIIATHADSIGVRELGMEQAVEPIITNSPNYANWRYDFTINEKINSKKLFEGLSSASPFIPRFDNMGNFKFDYIPDMSNGITIEDDHIIQKDDVIDFNFSRTEDVFTRVELKYNWDYARKEFASKRSIDVDVFTCEDIDGDTIASTYDYDYYGFKKNADGSGDHTNTTLSIDNIRGKFIRNDSTAERLVTWLLSWYMHKHLKMKIKLSLKSGLNLEVGDLVKFPQGDLLGGIKPYGIDYTYISSSVASYQQFHPVFIITSTNKTLEYCEISIVQLHTLWGVTAADGIHVNPDTGVMHDLVSGTFIGCDTVAGCDEFSACNYNQYATSNDGSCEYPEAGYDCSGECLTALDECGDCYVGGEEGAGILWNSCPEDQLDCNNDPGGTAFTDDCGNCVGGDTGYEENWAKDECGCCGGTGIQDGQCDCPATLCGADGPVEDCLGVCGGTAVVDCAGECNGTAVEDMCNECGGDGSTCGGAIELVGWGVLTGIKTDTSCPSDALSKYDLGSSDCPPLEPILPNSINFGLTTGDIGYLWDIENDFFTNGFELWKTLNWGSYCIQNQDQEDFPYESFEACTADINNVGTRDTDVNIDPFISNETEKYSVPYFIIKWEGDIFEDELLQPNGKITGKINMFLSRYVDTIAPGEGYATNNAWEPLLGSNMEVLGELLHVPHKFSFEITPEDHGLMYNQGYLYVLPMEGESHPSLSAINQNLYLLKDTLMYEGGTSSGTEFMYQFHNSEFFSISCNVKAFLQKSDIEFEVTGGAEFLKVNESDISVPPPHPYYSGGNVHINHKPYGNLNCEYPGDINNDGDYNILDVVSLANCVLNENCGDLNVPCQADMNGDFDYNVLDVVLIAHCVIAECCGPGSVNFDNGTCG